MQLNVSVVVITRNRPEILERNLQHLANQTTLPLEVLVVDSSERHLLYEPDPDQRFPFQLRLLHQASGGHQMPIARNYGAVRASGDIVAFLDDDCLADPDWLDFLLQAYASNPGVAGVGGRITDARWQFDPTLPVGRVDASGLVVSNFFGDPGGVVEVETLPGGNMSFRLEWLRKAGGFDPGYVATNHREDPDFCLRLGYLGARLVYQPRAHVLHLNARSLLSEVKPYHEFYYRYSFARNEAYFTCKHFAGNGAAWKRLLLEETVRLFRELFRSRSLVVLACVPVVLASRILGVIKGLTARQRLGREAHLQEGSL